ncbi:hypothetical protein [Runella slithyformis]|uniref:Uncharacterized protein n=1 Tax=Runella slithyformis (strain ATCC 29530 / DSM 19594 / LMG 11500 / NCIMB 11436 / LSU 4) TaxID=761193 RepID=A0A7U4E7L0_RUNSL|nr:hypothetical protein [Runella slithyformis]AEI50499.1 hypothetical protein Runsl_4154 [Runella slithyformis DSM 19594]
MKTFRSLTLWSAVGLVGLWGCNSKQYTASNDAEYDDLYGNSSSVAVAAKSGSPDEEKRSLRNFNPDYRMGQQQPNTTTEDYDYYDESYLSSRGIQRNIGPDAGYRSGFSDGYQTALNNNWGSYWNNPYRNNLFGWNSFGNSAMMFGLGYGFGSSFGNPYRFGSPFGWNSAFAYGYGDPFFSPYSYYSPFSAWGGFSNFGWGSPFGFGSFYSPYAYGWNSYNFYGGNFFGNNNVWYNGPNNNIQIVDSRRRSGTDYYNRVDRSANSYNRNNDNSPRYTNEGRRQGYDPSARTNSTTADEGYYSRPRGGADRSYNGYSSNSGSRSSSTYSSPSTQSSGYSSGTRGGATRSYGDQGSSTYSNQRSSSYSNNNSSGNSYNSNSGSGRSSYSSPSYSSPSPSYSSPSPSSSSSSGSSRGPR